MPRSDLSLLAATLRDRGAWIQVLMDAEARKRPKGEGLLIAERLNELGVDVYCANADAGTMVEEIANRLSKGRLRAHDHLEEWFAGYRRYRRDEIGDISDADDHLMCATGLMLVHGLGLATTENCVASEAEAFDSLEDERMSGRLGVTGYRCLVPMRLVSFYPSLATLPLLTLCVMTGQKTGENRDATTERRDRAEIGQQAARG